MKKLLLIACLAAMASICPGQTIDTLAILKSKALSYTSHELLKPNTYSSIAWSQIFVTHTGYKIVNVFRSKTIGGKSAYTFDFDKEMELISVNTDSINKQIKDSKAQIKESNEQIKRINETRDIKIEALKDKNPN